MGQNPRGCRRRHEPSEYIDKHHTLMLAYAMAGQLVSATCQAFGAGAPRSGGNGQAQEHQNRQELHPTTAMDYHCRVTKEMEWTELTTVRALDECERRRWADAYASSPATLDMIIPRCATATRDTWKDARMLFEEGGRQDGSRSDTSEPTRRPESVRKAADWATVEELPGGRAFCRNWNQGKCGGGTCPRGRVHACNAKMPNGEACNGPSHTLAGCPYAIPRTQRSCRGGGAWARTTCRTAPGHTTPDASGACGWSDAPPGFSP